MRVTKKWVRFDDVIASAEGGKGRGCGRPRTHSGAADGYVDDGAGPATS